MQPWMGWKWDLYVLLNFYCMQHIQMLYMLYLCIITETIYLTLIMIIVFSPTLAQI